MDLQGSLSVKVSPDPLHVRNILQDIFVAIVFELFFFNNILNADNHHQHVVFCIHNLDSKFIGT